MKASKAIIFALLPVAAHGLVLAASATSTTMTSASESSSTTLTGTNESSNLVSAGDAPSQGLFPNTCRSRREKLAYAAQVALHCGGALDKVWTCLTELTNPLMFMDCVEVFNNHIECQDAKNTACGELEPKCCRCQTMEPIPSNQNHGCLLEIYKGDSCGAACQLLDVSSGRYHREWFGSGKNNYRFYGNCSEAEQKGGDKFTQHEMCPTPWTEWD